MIRNQLEENKEESERFAFLLQSFAKIIEDVSAKFVSEFSEPENSVSNSAAEWMNFRIATFEKLTHENIGLREQVERLKWDIDSFKVEKEGFTVFTKVKTGKQNLAQTNNRL